MAADDRRGDGSVKREKSRLIDPSPFYLESEHRSKVIPYKPKKPCNFPGCRALVDGAYCDKHRPAARPRLSAAKRGYDRRWQRFRDWYLRRHPLCINFAECRNPATVVDHIKPAGRGAPFWGSEEFYQAMCKACHDRKTAKESGIAEKYSA